MTAHYLGPGRSGSDAQIATQLLKEGRQFSVARADLATDEGPTITVLATVGTSPAAALTMRPPDMPPPDDLPRQLPGDPLPMCGQIDTRIHPDDDFGKKGPTGCAPLRGWFRLLDGEPLSTLAAVLASDTWPPPTFVAEGPIGWMPTVELTVHVRSRPTGHWLACTFHRNLESGGMVTWDGTITDEHGRLIALSRQICVMPRRGSGPSSTG